MTWWQCQSLISQRVLHTDLRQLCKKSENFCVSAMTALELTSCFIFVNLLTLLSYTLFSRMFWLCSFLRQYVRIQISFDTCKVYRYSDLIKSIISYVVQWSLNCIVNACFKNVRLNHLRLAWTWASCLHSIKLNTQDEKKSIVKNETVFTCLQDWSIEMNYFIILIRHTSLKIDSEDAELIFAYLQMSWL